MNKMKEKKVAKSPFPIKTNQNAIQRELVKYIDDYPLPNKQKSKGKKYEKVSFKYSNLQIIKQMNKSRNQYFSPHSSLDLKKSQNEHKSNQTQLLLNNTKDTYKINVVRSKNYINSSYIDINDEVKSNPEEKATNVINSLKGGRTVTSKQSTVSSSKNKEKRAPADRRLNQSKQKFNDLSFNNDISFTKVPSLKIYNSNNVSLSQLTNVGLPNNSSTRKAKFVYRKKPVHLSSSIDLSTRRNISFLNPLLNESLGMSCLSKNAPHNKEEAPPSLNAEGVEDIHLKMVEIYQKKKHLYVNIAGCLGEEGEDITNNYLEKE